MEKQIANNLIDFIHESPTNFHAVLSIKKQLLEHGFKQLYSGEIQNILTGDMHFLGN